jgi:hypothetical protein
MIKIFILAIAILFVMSPAFAGSCPTKVGMIDAALTSGTAKNAKKVKMLRDKGEAQHKSGKHSESVATLVEAMKLAGIL